MTADERLDLLVIEKALHDEHINYSCKSFFEGRKLSLALLLKLEVNIESDELCGRILGNKDVCTILFELSLLNSTKRLNISSKSAAEDIFHLAAHFCIVPVKDHFERLGRLWLPLPEIVEVRLLINEHFVARARER